MTFAPRVRPLRGALVLIIAATVAACSGAAGSYPVLPARAAALEWRPTPGMRLVHHVSTALEASGPLTRPLSDQQKKPRTSLTRVTEVAAVGPDYFDLRFAQDGAEIPGTVRFSRDWAVVDVRLDDGPALGPREREAVASTLRRISGPFTQSAQVFRDWVIGETEAFEVPLSPLPGAIGSGQGSMTLRRLVLFAGREAAEFDWRARAEFALTGDPGRGVPGRIEITGREWRDIATGASLRVVADARASFTRQGARTRVTYRTEEVLDLEESRLP